MSNEVIDMPVNACPWCGAQGERGVIFVPSDGSYKAGIVWECGAHQYDGCDPVQQDSGAKLSCVRRCLARLAEILASKLRDVRRDIENDATYAEDDFDVSVDMTYGAIKEVQALLRGAVKR